MTEDIVERLRAEPYWVGGSQRQSDGDENITPFDAADEIVRLRGEVERLTLERDYWARARNEWEKSARLLEEENKRLTRERDAAIREAVRYQQERDAVARRLERALEEGAKRREERAAAVARAEAAERERDEARKTLNDLHERQMKLVADRDAAIREVSAAGRRQGEAEARMDAAIAERNTCWSDFGAVCEVLGNCEAEIAVDRAKSMQADLVEARNELDAVYNALGTADAEGAPDAAATIAILFKECSAAVCERDEAREAADALRETIKMETELQGQLQGELAAAEAKVAKLREALKPFAEAASMTADGFPDHDIMPMRLGQCRDARSALQETEQ